jgi:endonuclease/exonuclease/phosphatase family metal-dependent hydrolase
MVMRIWLGTWNVEQQFPDQSMLDSWFNTGRKLNPDLLAFGFQEADRNGTFTVSGYQPIREVTVNGRTKAHKNRQLLIVFQRNNWNEVVPAKVHAGQWRKDLSTPKKKLKFWAEYGKGAAVVTLLSVEGSGCMYAICSAHLDSKSSPERINQINQILNQAKTTAGMEPEVLFFMGDLNYRLNAKPPIQAKQTTADNMIDAIAKNRPALLKLDSFNPQDFPAGFVFPDPCDGIPKSAPYLPTYKRIYAGPAGVTARAAAGKLPSRDAVRDCFALKVKNNIVQVGERAGQYDLGWLDRIGYKVSSSHSGQVTHLCSGSCPDLVLSDHTPVYSVFDVR